MTTLGNHHIRISCLHTHLFSAKLRFPMLFFLCCSVNLLQHLSIVPDVDVCWINCWFTKSWNPLLDHTCITLSCFHFFKSVEAFKYIGFCILDFLLLFVPSQLFSDFICLPGQLGPLKHFIFCSPGLESLIHLAISSSVPSCPQTSPSASIRRRQELMEKVPQCQSPLCRISSLTQWGSQDCFVFLFQSLLNFHNSPFPRAPNITAITLTLQIPSHIMKEMKATHCNVFCLLPWHPKSPVFNLVHLLPFHLRVLPLPMFLKHSLCSASLPHSLRASFLSVGLFPLAVEPKCPLLPIFL